MTIPPLQAANTLQLFTFIRADLATFKPKPKPIVSSAHETGFSNGFMDPPEPSVEPIFPKSLFLIRPLNSSYELNPVAREAQASVPIPEGLDLDLWIIPPPKEEAVIGVTNGVSKKKKGKGKEKAEKGVGHLKSGKKKEKPASLIDVPSEETPEEKAQRERVSRREKCKRLMKSEILLCSNGRRDLSF